MQILYIAHRIPYPPDKGDKIRSFNEIKFLSKRHEVYLACLIDEDRDIEHVKALEKYCASVNAIKFDKRLAKIKSLFSLISNRPMSVSYFFLKALKSQIDQLLKTRRFDVIMVFSSSMAQYVSDVNDITKIIDFVDADSDKWRQYVKYSRFPFSTIYKIEATRLQDYEKEIIERFQHCIVATEKDAKLLKSSNSPNRLSVISNGVNFDYFFHRGDNYDPYTIVFVGAMDYFANVDGVLYFYKEIFPLIKEKIPEIEFYIVGSNPSREIQRLNNEPGVTVTGYVKDIRLYLSKASVCVVPLRIARGIQNKVLEAMAVGVPVVATPQALECIGAQPCVDLLMENEPDKFAKRVIEIIQNRKLQKVLSEQGRIFVEKRYNWEVNMRKLEKLLEDNTTQTSFPRTNN